LSDKLQFVALLKTIRTIDKLKFVGQTPGLQKTGYYLLAKSAQTGQSALPQSL